MFIKQLIDSPLLEKFSQQKSSIVLEPFFITLFFVLH